MKERQANGKKAHLAIYDTPEIMGKKLKGELERRGHTVLFEGPLSKETACTEAEVWITKWTFNLKGPFLKGHHPQKGIVTLSVGTDHIDKRAMEELGLMVENCPTSPSISVAEHAIALAYEGLIKNHQLPLLQKGQVIFRDYSDGFAEAVVCQMLLRARQIVESCRRAGRYEYFTNPGEPRRHDDPWKNAELSGLKVGMVGKDEDFSTLAGILRLGFNCELLGCDTAEYLDAFGIRQASFFEIMRDSDYFFLATQQYGEMRNLSIRADTMEKPQKSMQDSKVGVLGTGRIGSIIARMAKLGFECDVTAFDTTKRTGLERIGVNYVDRVEDAVLDRDFVFIALPLNDDTRGLVNEGILSRISAENQVIVNVTRDEIIDSGCLYGLLDENRIFRYATDVLPDDKSLWSRGKPSEMARKFVECPSVVATPHEGDASAQTMERMVREADSKIQKILGNRHKE